MMRRYNTWRTAGRHLRVLALAVVTGCGSGDVGEEQGEEAGERLTREDRIELSPEALSDLGLTFATAQVMELTPSLVVPAEIAADPDRVAIVGSRVSGRIAEVSKNVGDVVRAGEPLVVLESVDIGTATAEYIVSVARAEVARSAARRAERLFDEIIVSERRLEEAQAALRAAEADETAAASRLRTFGVSLPIPTGHRSRASRLNEPHWWHRGSSLCKRWAVG